MTRSRIARRWLVARLTAGLACWLLAGAPAHALDCWVPSIDASQLQHRKLPLAELREAVKIAEQVVRDNPHFQAMPRPIRIRSQFTVAPAWQQASIATGQVNIKAYQPDVWEGSCGLVPGADRCCSDGGVSLWINSPESLLFNQYADDPELRIFKQPRHTGTVAGFPEYEGRVLLSPGGRAPWEPVTVAELLDFKERRERKRIAEYAPAPYGPKPDAVQRTYERMKKTNPPEAEKYLANMQAEMARQVAEHRERRERGMQSLAADLAKIQQVRARMTPAQLAAQAYHGNGELRLGRADDPLSYPLAKASAAFPDKSDPERVQMIVVFVSVQEKDQAIERKATLQRTKETLDYPRLVELLR